MDLSSIDILGISAAVVAARDVDLLRSLAAAPGTARELAARLGLDPRATARVLDVLASVGLVVQHDDLFRASATLESLAKMGLGLEKSEDLWAHTTTFLRTGAPWRRMDGPAAEREAAYRTTVSSLGGLFEPVARRLADLQRRAPRRILDVACGSGVWGLAVACRFGDAVVTGLDLEAVLPAFEKRAESLGLAHRVSTLAGDMHAIDLPGGFDLVIAGNVLHLEPADRAAAFLRRLAASVAPGGEVIVVDAFAESTPEQRRTRAVYALHLAMRTEHGGVHSFASVGAWLESAGLTQVEVVELGPAAGPLGAVRAVAP